MNMLERMAMKNAPSPDLVRAWVGLVRAEQALLSKVEADLKAAGFPPLAWYDVLLELSREPETGLRPIEIERRTLLAQYNASRLIARLEDAGLVKREACPQDRRGQLVIITAKGRDMRKRMWSVYGAALSKHVGEKLSRPEAQQLAGLLAKLTNESH
jgi:DNA-binding MarR family transcriptional regulator